jgi:hypothetical protein
MLLHMQHSFLTPHAGRPIIVVEIVAGEDYAARQRRFAHVGRGP